MVTSITINTIIEKPNFSSAAAKVRIICTDL